MCRKGRGLRFCPHALHQLMLNLQLDEQEEQALRCRADG